MKTETLLDLGFVERAGLIQNYGIRSVIHPVQGSCFRCDAAAAGS